MNDITWIAQTPIAHRGLHNSGSIPENSLAAVEAAIAHQYAIEIDIHQLADGSIVVFHDDDLRRMTGAEGKIAAQTAATVQQFRLGGTEQTIPLLVEVLDLVNGQVPLLIEIKSKGKDSVGPLEAAVVKTLKSYRGLYAIQAFNPYSLEWLKHHSPTVPRGQLSGDFRGEDLDWSTQFLLSNLLLNWVSDPQFIGYDLRALPHVAPLITGKLFSLPIVAWTVRSQSDYAKAQQWADNVIFEHILP